VIVMVLFVPIVLTALLVVLVAIGVTRLDACPGPASGGSHAD
jgi:hypothetical protein